MIEFLIRQRLSIARSGNLTMSRYAWRY